MIHIDYMTTEKEQNLLDFIFGNTFPWFFHASFEPIKTTFFFHMLMKRNEEDKQTAGIINSSIYEDFKNLFLSVTKQAGIEVNIIYRAIINATSYYPDWHTGIHVDHDFPHKNFIMYLTDTKAPTYIFDENENIIEKSEPKKNRAVIFDGKRHAQGTCEPGETRVVLVFTFN